ncbi:MAG: transglycosylase domain-containing protein, partial [Muribaculaceae bacterium]|nr:transglycosylase domain-containing protein [Muribaculaceae bacterium]
SKQDLYNILPNNNLFHQYVNSLLAEQITILAYYNNHEVKPMPLVNYQISGLEQYDNWQPDSISLKTLILSKLKSKGHLASEYVTYDNIPYLVKATLIACEDPAFMYHTGVCPYAFGLIFKTLFDGRLPNGGGSTLTQQLIKNTFFTEDISIDRKVKDAITSLIAERIFHLSKHDILEIYLNMAEFGIGIYGITPASKYYFDKDINNLSPVEVLVLMYILPRPKFFEEALINDSTQLRQNLKRYILNNIGRLKQMNIIDNYPPLPLADVSFPGVNASLCLDITDWCNEDNL